MILLGKTDGKIMNKKFFFMAGLPRSGGTMLSSILNQNPDIYVSPQSVLPNMLGAAYNQYQSKENKDSDQWDNIHRVMEIIIPTFYGGYNEKYIIDKNFSWLEGHPYVILEHHLKNPIRVVCPVRNVIDILASWNRLCENDPNNKYDPEINKVDKTKRPMADKRADYFMTMGGEENGIRNSIENMKRILYPQFKNNIMLIDYDDLTNNTKETVEKVYDFLGIPHYDADLDNLSTPHTYTDHWGVEGHHRVKKTVQRENYILEDIFSPSIIKKYSGLEFWKEI
jgi:sulfotransferase